MNSRRLAVAPSSDRELVLGWLIEAPRARVFQVWTRRLPEWWGPHGMTTPVCEMDLRPGGIFRTVMRAPDGTEYPTGGLFLEVTPDERIVFTDAYEPGWNPSPRPFLTAVITFEDVAGMTRLIARARHWSAADREQHERMGFHQGWSESFERLAALAATAS
jgi:uncharacterized protein YndB with AHSA1/START domain